LVQEPSAGRLKALGRPGYTNPLRERVRKPAQYLREGVTGDHNQELAGTFQGRSELLLQPERRRQRIPRQIAPILSVAAQIP
jgi:hypothetical protein